jgi:acyl-CoA thioesterase FadM
MIKQPGSKMCFVCGGNNPIGFHAEFYVDGEEIFTEFVPREEHQGYPGIMHGGLQSTILDETIGRAAFLKSLWMVTARMEVTYRAPVPIGQKIRVTGRIQEVRGRTMTATGRIVLEDGTVAVEARGLYVQIPEERRREVERLVFGREIPSLEYLLELEAQQEA